MDIELLSTKYQVKRLYKEDAVSILTLCEGNPNYYQHCPPEASIEGILVDMEGMPPNKTIEDKYYIGFYQEKELIAVMDFIYQFPDAETAYIGFFMMEQKMQGKGIGTEIISECCAYLKNLGFIKIRLAYAKGNNQSEQFWLKNHFIKTGIEINQEGYVAVVMERI